MPSILNPETVDLIADNYCTNGFNKTKAMVDADYSPKYADTGHAHRIVFGNIRVKEAIAKKIADIKEKTVATRQQRQQFWTCVMSGELSKTDENGQEIGITMNMGDRLRASELLGKSEADFTENINTGDLERLKKLSEQEALEAKRLATIRLRGA